MRIFLSSLALALILAAPALAGDTNDQDKATAPTSSDASATHDDMNTVICKSLGPTIGSHLGGTAKLCMTKKKWLEHDALTQDTMNRALNNRSLSGQPGG